MSKGLAAREEWERVSQKNKNKKRGKKPCGGGESTSSDYFGKGVANWQFRKKKNHKKIISKISISQVIVLKIVLRNYDLERQINTVQTSFPFSCLVRTSKRPSDTMPNRPLASFLFQCFPFKYPSYSSLSIFLKSLGKMNVHFTRERKSKYSKEISFFGFPKGLFKDHSYVIFNNFFFFEQQTENNIQ